MLNGIKSQFDVTCALPPLCHPHWHYSLEQSPNQLYHTMLYHTTSTLPHKLYHTTMDCCHTGRSLSSFLSTFATLHSKSSGFIVALHNLQVQISLKYLAFCISPNMSLLATKVVLKSRDSFLRPTLKASHADPWVEFSHKSGLFFFNWPPGPKTPTSSVPP